MTDAGTTYRLHPDDALAAYALGVLEPGEARAIEDHLAACPACRAALARNEDVVGALGTFAEPVPPDPALRAALLDGIRTAEPRQAAATPRRPRMLALGLGIAATAALVTIAVLAVLLANTMGERDDARRAEQAMSRYLAEGGTLSALVPAPDAAADVATGHGSLAIAPDQDKAMIVTYDIPPSGDEVQYLAWAEGGGERIALGEMPVNDAGVGWLVFYPPEPMTAYDTVGITRVSPDAPDGESFLVAPVR